jgi:DNA-binding MarR family transcriptional regulator
MVEGETDESRLRACHPAAQPSFTEKQGQYVGFIRVYTLVRGRPPAKADLQRHFGVTPPSVHAMVISLERSGLIRREPGSSPTIAVLVNPNALSQLIPAQTKPSKPL